MINEGFACCASFQEICPPQKHPKRGRIDPVLSGDSRPNAWSVWRRFVIGADADIGFQSVFWIAS
jgi:hypothetical protein